MHIRHSDHGQNEQSASFSTKLLIHHSTDILQYATKNDKSSLKVAQKLPSANSKKQQPKGRHNMHKFDHFQEYGEDNNNKASMHYLFEKSHISPMLTLNILTKMEVNL